MKRKFKGLVVISDVLYDRYQKLSDRYHSLELSHNRKKEALRVIYDWAFENGVICVKEKSDAVRISFDCFKELLKICESALFCDGRQNTCIMRKKDFKSSCVTLNSKKVKK